MKNVQFVDKNAVVFDLSCNVESVILEFTEDGQTINFNLDKHEVRELIHELMRLKDLNHG